MQFELQQGLQRQLGLGGSHNPNENSRLGFEHWYQVNFSNEAATLLWVQKAVFEVCRDVRSMFLYPADGASNKEKILSLLDA